MIGLLGALPGLIGITFATDFGLLIVSALTMGFFLVSTSPIGMQYAAEITNPTPEGTSNGLITLFGQSSVIFVYIMEAMKNPDGSFTPALVLSLGLIILNVALITRLKDAPRVQPAA